MNEQFIKQEESIDLNGEDVFKLSNGNATILTYSQLNNIETLDQAFNGKSCLILLYEIRPNFGHWTCLTRHSDKTISDKLLEFFDPYSLQMDTELQFSKMYFNQNGIPHLTHLVKNSGMELIQNKIQLQQFAKDVNVCGRYAGYRARKYYLSLKEFQSIFLGKNETPDEKITRLTFDIIGK